MQVILLERIEKLGQMGDVVSVKPGYARNYLLPQRKALRATKANIAYFETRRSTLEASNLERRNEAQAAAQKMTGLSLVMVRSAGQTGQLYGSVTSRDIAQAMAEQGIEIDRRQVELAAPIKALGLHTAQIRLHPEVTVDVTLNVAQSADEARVQAERGKAVTEADKLAEAEAEHAELAEGEISEEAAQEFFESPESVAHETEETGGEASEETEK